MPMNDGERRGEIKIYRAEIDKKEHIQNVSKDIIKKFLEAKEIKKVIYVPGKIVNFVV